MNSIVENLLWFAAGVAGVLIFLSIMRRKPNKPTSTADKTNNREKEISTEIQPTSTAKDAFLSNIDKFSSILPQLNSSLNIESWSEQIVDINNPQLTELWKRCLGKIAVWKQMLSSWGLRQDTCKSFTYLDKYSNMYDTADNSEPEQGCKYRVIDGCWILTDEVSGDKRVVKKGLIEKL